MRFLAYLATGWDAKAAAPTSAANAALEERIGHIADGLSYMGDEGKTDREPALAKLRERYARILAITYASKSDAKSIHARGVHTPEALDVTQLIAWAQVEAVLALLALAGPSAERPDIITHWELARPLVEAFALGGDAHADTAQARATLVLLAATLPVGPLREAVGAALKDARGQEYLGVHEANGVAWLNAEAFAELACFLGYRESIEGRASVAMTEREVEDVTRIALNEGYKADLIAKALAAVKLPAESSVTAPS